MVWRRFNIPLLCLGKPFCNNETFGQYPLQVNGYRNLDECLEGAMVEGDIALLPSDHSVTYGQEVRCMYIFACSASDKATQVGLNF